MPIAFTPLHPLFAAEAGGVDIKSPLDPATIAAIDAAMDRYAVLVFRDSFPTRRNRSRSRSSSVHSTAACARPPAHPPASSTKS